MRFNFVRPGRRRACGLVLIGCLAALRPGTAHAFINYSWKAIANGSIDDPSKWTPSGVPTSVDNLYFGQLGTYTVTFPATVPNTATLVTNAGSPTWTMTSPHTTGSVNASCSSGILNLTLGGGTLNADYLQVGTAGGTSNVTLLNGAIVHSQGINNPNGSGFGDHFGYSGQSNVHVYGGAQYYSDMVNQSHWPLEVGSSAGSVGKLEVAGLLSVLSHQYSGMHLTGGAGMISGVSGTADVFIYNGGYLDATGDVQLGRDPGAQSYMTVGPVSALGTSYLLAHQKLWIGRNGSIGAPHAELTVQSRAYVQVGGACEVGDPDIDVGSFLRINTGGSFYADGGLKIWPAAGTPLDLRGGHTYVRGGTFVWPANKFLSINGSGAETELWISNGLTNTAPNTAALSAELFLGRGGHGTLHLTHAGTVFPLGAGATTLGDSAAGTGTLLVDSTATFSSAGPVNVGNKGTAAWTIMGGALGDVGTVAVGVASGGTGTLYVSGAGSRLRARDNLWIGGGFGGAGGTGHVLADSGGTIEILHVTGVNPALTTVYAPTGSLDLSHGGLLTTSGNVSDASLVTIDGGEVDALSLTMTGTGTLEGHGRVAGHLQNSGVILPYAPAFQFGAVRVNGDFQQFGTGTYRVALGTAAGVQSDTLVVSGPATLAGKLELSTAGGFSPTPGMFFTILTCSARTGTFSTVTWNGFPLTSQATVVYESDRVGVLIPGTSGVLDPAGPATLAFAPIGSRSTPEFQLTLPEPARVTIDLFDVRGREVAELFEGSLGAGPHRLAAAPVLRALPSGDYFARSVVRTAERTRVLSARAVFVH